MSLTLLLQQIAAYAKKYARNPADIHLLAVSKKQPIEKVIALHTAGQRAFGENYLQEALPKIAALPTAEWHFIGKIQTNKTRAIATHFSWVHSVENSKIAKRLSEQRPSEFPPLNICIEVNLDAENSKGGVQAADVFALAEQCIALPNVRLRGLMALPAPAKTFIQQRATFSRLRDIRDTLIQKALPLDTLSMGTSQDFEAAIAEGATIIRIGTAIFDTPYKELRNYSDG